MHRKTSDDNLQGGRSQRGRASLEDGGVLQLEVQASRQLGIKEGE